MADTGRTTPTAPATVEAHLTVASKTSSGVARTSQLERTGTERIDVLTQSHDGRHTIVNVRHYPDGTGIISVHRDGRIVAVVNVMSDSVEYGKVEPWRAVR